MKELITKEETQISAAEKLRDIDKEIEALEADRDILRGYILQELKKRGFKGVKTEDGTFYIRAERTTLKVKNEASAVKWALEHDSMKVDTAKAWKILKREYKLPKFFTKNTTEYLTIKHPQELTGN